MEISQNFCTCICRLGEGRPRCGEPFVASPTRQTRPGKQHSVPHVLVPLFRRSNLLPISPFYRDRLNAPRSPRRRCHQTRKGFKDALNALVVMRHPELEHNGKQEQEKEKGMRDLVFNHLLVRPELERVRAMAWLQAKVLNKPLARSSPLC